MAGCHLRADSVWAGAGPTLCWIIGATSDVGFNWKEFVLPALWTRYYPYGGHEIENFQLWIISLRFYAIKEFLPPLLPELTTRIKIDIVLLFGTKSNSPRVVKSGREPGPS